MNARTAASVVGALAVLAGSAAMAAGDATPELAPSFPLGAIVCSLVAVAGVCVVGFKNAKRKQPE